MNNASEVKWNNDEVLEKMREWHKCEVAEERERLEKHRGESIESYVQKDPSHLSVPERNLKLTEVDFGYRAMFHSKLSTDIFLLPILASEKKQYNFNELVEKSKKYESMLMKQHVYNSLEDFVSQSLKELTDAGIAKKFKDDYYFWPEMTSRLGKFKDYPAMYLKKGKPNEAPDEVWFNKAPEMRSAIHSFILNESDPSLDVLRKKGWF